MLFSYITRIGYYIPKELFRKKTFPGKCFLRKGIEIYLVSENCKLSKPTNNNDINYYNFLRATTFYVYTLFSLFFLVLVLFCLFIVFFSVKIISAFHASFTSTREIGYVKLSIPVIHVLLRRKYLDAIVMLFTITNYQCIDWS